LHSSQAVRRNSTSAASCTARRASSSCGVAVTSRAPASVRAERISMARSGTSVAGVRTPTQISASGSCRRQSSLQTKGSESGTGELTGSLEIRELGRLGTPVYLTSTHAVGRVYDGAVTAAMAADPRVGVDEVVIPVVGECDDSWLSDARVPHVQPADVGRAL